MPSARHVPLNSNLKEQWQPDMEGVSAPWPIENSRFKVALKKRLNEEFKSQTPEPYLATDYLDVSKKKLNISKRSRLETLQRQHNPIILRQRKLRSTPPQNDDNQHRRIQSGYLRPSITRQTIRQTKMYSLDTEDDNPFPYINISAAPCTPTPPRTSQLKRRHLKMQSTAKSIQTKIQPATPEKTLPQLIAGRKTGAISFHLSSQSK